MQRPWREPQSSLAAGVEECAKHRWALAAHTFWLCSAEQLSGEKSHCPTALHPFLWWQDCFNPCLSLEPLCPVDLCLEHWPWSFLFLPLQSLQSPWEAPRSVHSQATSVAGFGLRDLRHFSSGQQLLTDLGTCFDIFSSWYLQNSARI